jgi:hypothetical protein
MLPGDSGLQEWHVRGGRRNHIPIILRSFNSQTHQLPEATPAMGTGAAQILAKALVDAETEPFVDDLSVDFSFTMSQWWLSVWK